MAAALEGKKKFEQREDQKGLAPVKSDEFVQSELNNPLPTAVLNGNPIDIISGSDPKIMALLEKGDLVAELVAANDPDHEFAAQTAGFVDIAHLGIPSVIVKASLKTRGNKVRTLLVSSLVGPLDPSWTDQPIRTEHGLFYIETVDADKVNIERDFNTEQLEKLKLLKGRLALTSVQATPKKYILHGIVKEDILEKLEPADGVLEISPEQFKSSYLPYQVNQLPEDRKN